MRYLREVLRKNRATVSAYLAIGVLGSFLANYKANYFQRVIDGLAEGTQMLPGILFYGLLGPAVV